MLYEADSIIGIQSTVCRWNQSGWEFGDNSLAANNVFESRLAVDEITRIVDVSLILGSECATELH
jgi:hypothetical protein